MAFIKQNEEPIEIEYMPDPDRENDLFCDYVPMFEFEGEYHRLDNYVRTHDNPWCPGGNDIYPSYIHAYDCFDYTRYVKYVEVVDDDHINVYREEC